MLASDVPTIVSATPTSGTILTTGSPAIHVAFSETMAGSTSPASGVLNPANYLLFGSQGNLIPINSVSFTPGTTIPNSEVDLVYNGGNPLVVDTYKLYVRGDRMFDVDDSFPISPISQLVAASAGQNRVAVATLPGNGGIGSVGQYELPDGFAAPARPFDVSFADLNQDNLPDLVVTSSSRSDEANVFLGRAASAGGGFSQTPDLILSLPASAAIGPRTVAFGDFNLDNKIDIVVANANTDNVTVFMNTGGAGALNFAPGVSFATQDSPIGVVVADFNADTFADIAVVTNGAGATSSLNILRGIGDGTFAAVSPILPTPLAIGTATSIGVGLLGGPTGNDTLPDIVLGGSAGLVWLRNTGGSFGFAAPVSLSATPVIGLAVGHIDAGAADDIVALTNAAAAEVWRNDGLGAFTMVSSTTVLAPAAGGKIALGDLDGNGRNDIAVTHPATGRVSTIRNLTTAGTIGNVTIAAVSGTDRFHVTSRNHRLTTGQSVTITGVNGTGGMPAAINTTSTVTVIDADTYYLDTPVGVGAYTNGGSWAVTGSTPTFTSMGAFTADAGSVGVAIADTNQDGLADVVTANADPATENVSLFLSAGDGTLLTSTSYGPLPTATRNVATGDLNQDGVPDIVTINNSGSTPTVSILFGQPNGTYLAAQNITLPNSGVNSMVSMTGVALADVNGDGKLDILMTSSQSASSADSGVGVLQNNMVAPSTTAAFSFTSKFVTGRGANDMAVGDFNGDGRLDILVSHNGSSGSGDRRGVTYLQQSVAPGVFDAGIEILGGFFEMLSNTRAVSIVTADFNGDQVLDFATIDDNDVYIVRGLGNGTFTPSAIINTTLPNQSSLEAADFNGDGFMDLVVTSSSTGPGAGIVVLTNQLGNGFVASAPKSVVPGTGLASVLAVDLNSDGRQDIIVSTASGGGGSTLDNVYALINQGNSVFANAVPYRVGQNSGGALPTSYLALTGTSLVLTTTFKSGGTLVNAELISNGDFEGSNLASEAGSLTGWNTFKLLDTSSGSHGRWMTQTGSMSPLSGVTVPVPSGSYRAMLDQANLDPYWSFFSGNPNPASSYQGTNVLYQDITIPSGLLDLTFSMSLYLNHNATPLASPANPLFSDPGATPSLDYRVAEPNQQVRVDIVDASDPEGILGVGAGVLKNLYITGPGTTGSPGTISYTFTSSELALLAGRNVRLRVAAANNQAQLLVGVDNVRLQARYNDTTKPTLSGLGLRNPGFLGSPNGMTPHTNDSTIIGRIDDNGGTNNIAYVEFDPANNGFGSPKNSKTITFDAYGNFAFTLPNLAPGLTTVNVRVMDKAGNFTDSSVTFFMQSSSVTEWQPVGPQGISTRGQAGIDFTQVSGRITVTVVDQADPTGNTYFIGSANGGVWRTTDGGASWAPLTDNVVDASGVPISVPIGGLAQSTTEIVNGVGVSNTKILYAGLGVAALGQEFHAGSGVLKSTDNGKTWFVAGNSGTVLANARVSKVVVSTRDANVVYVAVASGGNSGPGVYKSSDGGLTWANVLRTPVGAAPNSNMVFAAAPLGPGGTVPTTTALASVTDMVLDPFFPNDRLIIGLGNMGLVGSSTTAGVWQSVNGGASWQQVTGGHDANLASNPTPARQGRLPTGASVGRVTLGFGTGRVGDERFAYVLVGDPPPGTVTPPAVNFGTYSGTAAGLYKTKDNLLNFTEVMLRQFVSTGSATAPHSTFTDINILNVEASNAGALVVDPDNPNVVYVGGSNRWGSSGTGPRHALIRVDTGNMRDTTYSTNRAPGVINSVPTNYPNDGDDIDKYNASYPGPGDMLGAANTNYYDFNSSAAPTDPYVGEGVYWYDIIQDSSGSNGNRNNLPGAITHLTFDSQGRLVIGTAGGIWRGQNYGFGYDPTSGGRGILVPPGPPVNFNTNGMSLTSINGNLQISDVTSVAIDPQNPGTYYTTQIGTGGAATSQLLVWESQGVTGPILPNGANLRIPTASLILAAKPPAGSAPGAPITLYRIWQYADINALQPEVSINNGETWSSATLTGLAVSGSQGGVFPPMAVNPTPIPNGFDSFGDPFFYNELLYGTNKVFLSQTSGNIWNDITNRATLSLAGGQITTLAISPTHLPQPGPSTNAYYAGTDRGEVFVTLNGGGDAWPLTYSGAPPWGTRKINGITVDPNNPLVIYASIDGAGPFSHLWRGVINTTPTGPNGTLAYSSTTWTSISSNLPPVSAYATVVDPRVGLGAPSGKLYVATEVGVYVSANGGSSWSQLGNGLPNVPIVGLDFNSNLETLAVAALGRGVFTINTASISVIPDQVIDQNQPSNTIPFTINDPGLPAGSYTVTASSDNQALIPNGNIVLGGSGPNRTIRFSPALNANTPTNGVANITITLVSGANTFTQTFQVTVNFVDQLPTHVGLPDTFTVDKNTTGTINFTVDDVEDNVTATVATQTQGGPGNEVQTVTVNGTGGAFTLTFNGQTTAPMPYNVPATGPGSMENALRALTSVGGPAANTNVTVTKVGNVYTVTFTGGPVAGVNVPEMTSATGLNVTATSDNPALIPNSNLIITAGTGKSRSLAITPIANLTGTANVTITITDANGGVTTKVINVLVRTTAPLPFTDDFDRPNNIFLGPGWNETTGDFTLNGLKGVASSAAINIATLNAMTAADISQTATITLNVSTDTEIAGLVARVSGGGATMTGYWGGLYRAGTGGIVYAVIQRFVNGVPAVLGYAALGSANVPLTGTVRFDVVNDSLKLFLNGSLVAYAYDSAITAAGLGGLRSTQNNVFDSYSASAIALTNAGVGFNDNFNVTPPDLQLSRFWRDREGALVYQAGGITGSAISNVATLNGVNQADAVVQANVAVGPNGSYAGLIARYNGPGNGNYYVGVLQQIGATTHAIIYLNSGGTFHTLSSRAVNTSAGLLRFEIVGDAMKLYLNGDLVGFANDTNVTAAGTVGVLSSQGNSIDNVLFLNPVAYTTPTLTFNDSLNVGAGAQLSTHWRYRSGIYVGAPSGTGVTGAPGSSGFSLATVNGINQTDSFVEARITSAVGTHEGVVARYNGFASTNTGIANFYYADLVRTGTSTATIYLYRNLNGAWTSLASQNVTYADNSLLRLEVVGDSLKVYYANALVAYGNDATLASGTFGIMGTGNNSNRVTLFSAGVITPSVSSGLPFTDNFDSLGSGQQLSLFWTNRQGNFSGTGAGGIIGNGALNLATVNGINDTNLFVQAQVNLAASGQYEGVVGRYSGTGVANFYMGALIRSGSTVNAVIYRNIGGTWALLASSSVGSTNSGLLRLEIVGDSLELFLNGNLVASAYDTNLASGSVGVIGTAGNTTDSFSANKINLLTPSLPHSDNFNALSAGAALDLNWVNRAGLLLAQNVAPAGMSGMTIIGTGATNFATLNQVGAAIVSASQSGTTVTVNTVTPHSLVVGQKVTITGVSVNGYNGEYVVTAVPSSTSFTYTNAIAGLTPSGGGSINPEANVSVQANVALPGTVGAYTGLVARYQGGPNPTYYFAGLYNAGSVVYAWIHRNTNGAESFRIDLKTLPAGTLSGLLRLEVAGDSLQLYLDNNLVAYGNDPNPITFGSTGFFTTANGVVDNFSASAIALTSVSISPAPFTDSFGSAGNISSSWSHHQGNMTVSGGALRANNVGDNLVTLNGVSQANVDVNARVTIATSGAQAFAGVAARATGGGASTSMYWGGLQREGSTYYAVIYRVVNNTRTLLSYRQLASAPGTPPVVRFQVVGDSMLLFLDNVLTVAANDTALTTGSVGLYGTGAATTTTFDDFSATTFTPSPVTIPAAHNDALNVAAGAALGASWQNNSGAFVGTGSAVTGITLPVPVESTATLRLTANVTNTTVQANVSLGATGFVGLVSRFVNTGNTYFGALAKSGANTVAQIYRFQNGVRTALVTSAPLGTSSGMLRFDVVNDSLKLYLNGELVAYAFDTNLTTAGTVGLLATQGNSAASFSANTASLNTVGLPFSTDPFSGPDGTQLSNNWRERYGNFGVVGGQLEGKAAINLAVLNGLVTASASVNVQNTVFTAVNQHVGLVANYSGPGDSNMYLAFLIFKGGTTVDAYIYKNVNGTWTVLKSQLGVTGFGVNSQFGFQVTGGTLRLFINNAELFNVIDANPLSGGTVGIRSAAGVRVDGFSAN